LRREDYGPLVERLLLATSRLEMPEVVAGAGGGAGAESPGSH
jgi:hypothetical protein